MNSQQGYQKNRSVPNNNPMNPPAPSRFPNIVHRPSNNFPSNQNPPNPKPNNYFYTEESKPSAHRKVEDNEDDDDDDDDLLDISDTELIRASQVVESQLRFTNNVHHTTSNAMNIFSQFNNNNNYNNDSMSVKLMMGGGGGGSMYNTDLIASQLDDVKTELKHVRTENMQKDGEVRILRDKLKRLEQEMQRFRTEKVESVKRLQQQQEEAKKSLQKQIEFKELENQFKSQEIVELTMKYKVLESSVKKNPVLSSTPLLINSNNTAVIVPSKTGPTKRVAQPSMSHFDTENENPIHEYKRPNLQTTTNTPQCMRPPPVPNRPPLSPFNSAKPKTPVKLKESEETKKTIVYKRTFALNIKSKLNVKQFSADNKSSNQTSKIYKLIDSLVDVKISIVKTGLNLSNILPLPAKFLNLAEFLKTIKLSEFQAVSETLIERVEFVTAHLNNELVKLIKFYMDINEANLNSLALIADVISASFDVVFLLFHLRVSLIQLKTCSDLAQLVKLKVEFFKLIKTFLKSRVLSMSVSRSSSSYAMIKILNSLLTGLDRLIYAPALASDLGRLCLSVSLADGVHNLRRSRLRLAERWMKMGEAKCGTEDDARKKMKKRKMNLETSIEMDENMCRMMDEFEEKRNVNQSQDEDEDDDDGGDGEMDEEGNDEDDDDDCCILKCFYEKTIKYFGDFVYSIETQQISTTLEENTQTQNTDDDINMITTIAVDDQGSKETNFNIEGKMPHSKSQTEFQCDILQSQTPIDDEKKFDFPENQKNAQQPTHISPNSASSLNTNASSTAPPTTSTLNPPILNIVQLQTQFLSNYVHFLHNYKLFNSIQKNLSTKNHSTHTSKCSCFKEMLTGFLVLIDHQFNERFINGAVLLIEESVKSTISAAMFPGNVITSEMDFDERANNEHLNTDLASTQPTNTSVNNQFMFLMIVRCCNALVSLFDWLTGETQDAENQISSSDIQMKKKFYETFKDDYRLRNFYCLFQLAELTYEELLGKYKISNESLSSGGSSLLNEGNNYYYLFASLNSLRNLFKIHVEDFFSLD